VSGPLTEPARRPLPAGRARHGLTQEEVTADQRRRLLEGLLVAVAAKGYAALTVADISAAARVSRRTFYEHFSDKEDCFMAAIDAGTQELLTEMLEAVTETDDWVEIVKATAAAYLRGFVKRPQFARAFNLDILSAGPRGLEFRAEVHLRFAEFYRDVANQAREADPSLPEAPEATFRLATGAFDEFLVEWVRQGKIDELEELAPLAGFLAAALMRGAPEAATELQGIPALGVSTLPL
jgi:AcrR family transcriptional regulator